MGEMFSHSPAEERNRFHVSFPLHFYYYTSLSSKLDKKEILKWKNEGYYKTHPDDHLVLSFRRVTPVKTGAESTVKGLGAVFWMPVFTDMTGWLYSHITDWETTSIYFEEQSDYISKLDLPCRKFIPFDKNSHLVPEGMPFTAKTPIQRMMRSIQVA